MRRTFGVFVVGTARLDKDGLAVPLRPFDFGLIATFYDFLLDNLHVVLVFRGKRIKNIANLYNGILIRASTFGSNKFEFQELGLPSSI